MGANWRNMFGVSRRFAIRYDRANDPEYMALVERYSQSGKVSDDDHKERVRAALLPRKQGFQRVRHNGQNRTAGN